MGGPTATRCKGRANQKKHPLPLQRPPTTGKAARDGGGGSCCKTDALPEREVITRKKGTLEQVTTNGKGSAEAVRGKKTRDLKKIDKKHGTEEMKDEKNR